MATFDRIFLKKNIRIPKSTDYILTGIPYKVELESDNEICVRLPSRAGMWVQKTDCVIDASDLGPFKGTTLTI